MRSETDEGQPESLTGSAPALLGARRERILAHGLCALSIAGILATGVGRAVLGTAEEGVGQLLGALTLLAGVAGLAILLPAWALLGARVGRRLHGRSRARGAPRTLATAAALTALFGAAAGVGLFATRTLADVGADVFPSLGAAWTALLLAAGASTSAFAALAVAVGGPAVLPRASGAFWRSRRREPAEQPAQTPLTPGGRVRSPELDGIRGIAVLMVIEVHHSFLGSSLNLVGLSELQPVAVLGWSGVDLFFVLSGFLLGGILMDRKGSPNYFKAFYVRRVCRTFPIYFLVVVPLLLLAPSAPVTDESSRFGGSLPWWTYVTYTQNFAMAEADRLGSLWLATTWSLAVEEQFYLVLPLLLWVVPRPKLPHLLIGLIALTALARVALFAGGAPAGYEFAVLLPWRGEGLMLGALGAWAVRNDRCLRLIHQGRSALYALLVALTASAALLVTVGPYGGTTSPADLFPLTYGFTLLAVLFTCAVLIAVTERRGPVSGVARNPLLRKLGIIGYGTYLFQLPVQGGVSWVMVGGAFEHLESSVPLRLTVEVVSLAMTLFLATLSWLWFEKRIVTWGRSFLYEGGRSSSAEISGAGT